MKNKSFYFSFLFSLFVLNVFSQKSDSIEVVHGSEKYKKEVLIISKTYSKILDSLQKDSFEKMSNDSLYWEKEMKTRPKKYRGYDGGIIGYLMEEETKKIETIINKFMKIDRISSSSTKTNENGNTEYHFYYDRTQKDPDGSKKTIHGVVFWTED